MYYVTLYFLCVLKGSELGLELGLDRGQAASDLVAFYDILPGPGACTGLNNSISPTVCSTTTALEALRDALYKYSTTTTTTTTTMTTVSFFSV